MQDTRKSHDQYGIQIEAPSVKLGQTLPSSQRLEDLELSGTRIGHLFHEQVCKILLKISGSSYVADS